MNGREVASGHGVPSVSSRLYRTAVGVDAAPTVDSIVEALRL